MSPYALDFSPNRWRCPGKLIFGTASANHLQILRTVRKRLPCGGLASGQMMYSRKLRRTTRFHGRGRRISTHQTMTTSATKKWLRVGGNWASSQSDIPKTNGG